MPPETRPAAVQAAPALPSYDSFWNAPEPAAPHMPASEPDAYAVFAAAAGL